MAIYVGKHIRSERLEELLHVDIEAIWIKVFVKNKSYHIGTIYRPPSEAVPYWQKLESCLESLLPISTVIMGDFNTDALITTDPGWKHLENLLLSNGLENFITEPTRITSSRQSCLDLMISNTDSPPDCQVIETHLSDHQLILGSFEVSHSPVVPSATAVRRDWSKFNIDLFKDYLSGQNINSFSSSGDIDELWSEWHNKVMAAIDACSPIKSFRARKRKCLWMTPELLNLIHKRKWLYRRIRSCKFQDKVLFKQYRKVRNKANTLYRQLKNEYFQHLCLSYKKNPGKLWNVIRTVTGRDNQSAKPVLPLADLNDYFSSLVSSSHSTHPLPVPFGPPAPTAMIKFSEIMEEKVVSLLSNLDASKSAGPDGIPPWLLKVAAAFFAPSVTYLLNESLSSGIVPKAFKMANITPIPKPNLNHHLPQSYRGISLTSVVSKILESVVKEQVSHFFDYGTLFNDSQYGFCPGRCCEDLLLTCVNDWQQGIDKGKSIAVAFLDISKAFDNVDHQILLIDLSKMGFSGSVLNWFASYLSDRYQRVASNHECSAFSPVEKGVPQGSILGPLLFNFYISHLPRLISSSSARVPSYADDLTVFSVNDSLLEAASAVSKAVGVVGNDLLSRGLDINVRKSSAMFLGPEIGLSSSDSLSISYNNVAIPTLKSTKLLGVFLDNRLTWDDQVKQITTKVGRKIGVLLRSRKFLSPQARRLFLLSVILPDFDYCSPVFATSISQSSMQRLEALERRAVRACLSVRKDEPTAPLFVCLNIAPLKDRWLLKILTTTFQAVKELRPPSVNGIFSKPTHQYATRGSKNDAVVPCRPAYKVGSNSLSFRLSIVWNALPLTCREATSLLDFKKRLLDLDDPTINKLRDLAFHQIQS